ncbi:MAG: hypothetical protein ACLPTF_11345 [Steroidobacteraceae bacterium]
MVESTGRQTIAGYAAASIQLFSRLWADLEVLSDQLAATTDQPPDVIELRLEMFRLELIVLLDNCRSARWRSMLSPEHRLVLRATLEDLLATLAVPPDAFGRAVIFQAQNQVFDAVLSRCNGHVRQALDRPRIAGVDDAGPALRSAQAFSLIADCLPV